MRLHASLLAAVITCFSPLPSHADIAPEPMSGGISLSSPGHKKTDIALVDNTVKIKVTPQRCTTQAFFRLHNTGKATELEVGFPLLYKGESTDFQVFADGVLLKFKDRVEHTQTPIGQKITQHWKVWRMRFKAGQTQRVEARYSNPPAPGSTDRLTGIGYPSYRKWRRTGFDYNLRDYGHPESVELHEWIAIKQVSYVLVSGSYWKGPIGRCRVEVDISEVPSDSFVDVQPPAHYFSAQKVVWDWSKVEPRYNVAVTFMGASPQQTMPYLETIATRQPEDEALLQTLTAFKKDFADAQTVNERRRQFAWRKKDN
ncbi:MAG TPA: hypothetical protein VF719_01590 [Abditibacteriaceae bacterium]